jgi:hypothetical protein
MKVQRVAFVLMEMMLLFAGKLLAGQVKTDERQAKSLNREHTK